MPALKPQQSIPATFQKQEAEGVSDSAKTQDPKKGALTEVLSILQRKSNSSASSELLRLLGD